MGGRAGQDSGPGGAHRHFWAGGARAARLPATADGPVSGQFASEQGTLTASGALAAGELAATLAVADLPPLAGRCSFLAMVAQRSAADLPAVATGRAGAGGATFHLLSALGADAEPGSRFAREAGRV